MVGIQFVGRFGTEKTFKKVRRRIAQTFDGGRRILPAGARETAQACSLPDGLPDRRWEHSTSDR